MKNLNGYPLLLRHPNPPPQLPPSSLLFQKNFLSMLLKLLYSPHNAKNAKQAVD